MQLTPGVSIERGDVTTRQTLFDLVANATIGTVAESDLSAEYRSIQSQSDAPTPSPGLVWYDQTDKLMKVFTDEIDNTGCSCWLAFGPDRFDVAVYASEPIPFGAAVQLTGDGRGVKLPPSPTALGEMSYSLARWEVAHVIGFNNNGNSVDAPTAASGTWFSCAIEGFVWAWHPVNKDTGGSGWLSTTGNPGFDCLASGGSGLTSPSGATDFRGALVWLLNEAIQVQGGPVLTYGAYRATALHTQYVRQLFVRGRVCRTS